MMIHDVTARAGGRKRRKRVGRGESSGLGRTCGRGNKGQQSRTGYSGRVLTEGGAMPIFRRMPKRGFNNFNFRTEYVGVNLDDLEASFGAGDRVDADALLRLRLVQGAEPKIKVLGRGTLTKKLTVVAHAVSGTAKAAIEKAGGSVELLARRDSAALAKAKRKTMKGKKPAATPSRLEKKKAARA